MIAAPQRVYIYSDSYLPEPNTHGAGLTICARIQAFLDLGCEVEFVLIRTKNEEPPLRAEYFKQITYTVVDARKKALSVCARAGYRAAYLAGWPRNLAWQQLFQARKTILREAEARVRKDPEAIHVFHYLQTACVIPSLSSSRTIYANHDIESEFIARNCTLNQEKEKRKLHGWEKRKILRYSEMERAVAQACTLVLCVAPSDAQRMVKDWSVPLAAYLPISIANGDTPLPAREHRADGVLRLLHVGNLEHLPTYTSLEFLFTRVFPLLDAATMAHLHLEVAGKIYAESERTKEILELARSYPMVRFTGFVDDIRTAYRRNDLQVVASTQATGRRSRIIESWALGRPVLSTTVGCGGVMNIIPGKNILIADDPEDFARSLKELVHAPERLDEIAFAARRTYDREFGRKAVASALRELLNARLNLQIPPVVAII